MSYQEDGFVIIKGILDTKEFENTFICNLGRIPKKLYGGREAWEYTLSVLDDSDKELLYQSTISCENSYASNKIKENLKHIFLDFLKGDTREYQFSGPQPLINMPNSKRLLYYWHAESCYYPKRRNFLNVWFPLFTDKHEGNGTMYFKKGSHKVKWRSQDFIEYNSGPNSFRQYEIPEKFHKDFEEVPVVASPGDIVIFHPDLIHRSSENKSKEPSFAGVMRVFDPSEDLTFSADMLVTPYGKDIGRHME